MNLQVRDDVIDLLSLDEYCTSSLMSPLPNNYEPPSTHAIQELMVGRCCFGTLLLDFLNGRGDVNAST